MVSMEKKKEKLSQTYYQILPLKELCLIYKTKGAKSNISLEERVSNYFLLILRVIPNVDGIHLLE